MSKWLKHHRILLGLSALVSAILTSGVLVWHESAEPIYRGHCLSEWLDAYDTNLRFEEGDGRRKFNDAEIETALNALGESVLPRLLKWVRAKDFPYQRKANRLLERQRWIRFRFTDAMSKQCLASRGFQFYGCFTKPLQPALIRMTFSRDPDLRDIAYECFYFSRPDRQVFLPVAYRGLKESSVAEMTAQWLVERFPEDAEQAGMRSRFPQFYSVEGEKTNQTSAAKLE
ncbi:MAG TPA: hypothetical protein VJA21_06385 [Verrucomicrobiae bacterium]